MRPIQDDPLFLAFKREWEDEHPQDYTEHPSRSASISFVCFVIGSATIMIGAGAVLWSAL